MDDLKKLLQYFREQERKTGDTALENIYLTQLRNKTEKTAIFGAGSVGHEVCSFLGRNGIHTDCFCSSFSGGGIDKATGLPVLSLDMLFKEFHNPYVVLAIGSGASGEEKDEIRAGLLHGGVEPGHIIERYYMEEKVTYRDILAHEEELEKLYYLLEDERSKEVFAKRLYYQTAYFKMDRDGGPMYFDKEIMTFGGDEVIIDGGAWIGDTVKECRNYIGSCRQIISFEPDDENYKKLAANMQQFNYVVTEKKGLWDSKTELFFCAGTNASSCIQETGETRIETVDLDGYCLENGSVPTFIKMDIEGAEYKALLGAQNLIKKYQPKLAVCIYHKPEDLYEIPLLIHELNPEYKLYIRHYSDAYVDTVCYALPERR